MLKSPFFGGGFIMCRVLFSQFISLEIWGCPFQGLFFFPADSMLFCVNFRYWTKMGIYSVINETCAYDSQTSGKHAHDPTAVHGNHLEY